MLDKQTMRLPPQTLRRQHSAILPFPPINQVAELEELPAQFLCGVAVASPCCLDAGHQSCLFGAILGKANLQVLEVLSLRASSVAVSGR